MQTLPINPAEQKYQPCCGKMLCMGCIYAVLKRGNNILLCPFCRAPEATSDGEAVERIMKRVEADDAVAIHTLGCCHDAGERGMQQDYEKAVELWLRAGELGCAKSYNNVGGCYFRGEGVERDTMKARYYLKLAAMGGSVYARHNLGILEENAGNINKAMMHWMIAARSGYDTSLYKVQGGFNGGHIMADDYEEVVHSHEESKDEMKSDQRDAAAAWIASNRNRSILPSFTKKLCFLCSLMYKMVDYIFELHGM
jgi:TPR repeat protein